MCNTWCKCDTWCKGRWCYDEPWVPPDPSVTNDANYSSVHSKIQVFQLLHVRIYNCHIWPNAYLMNTVTIEADSVVYTDFCCGKHQLQKCNKADRVWACIPDAASSLILSHPLLASYGIVHRNHRRCLISHIIDQYMFITIDAIQTFIKM